LANSQQNRIASGRSYVQRQEVSEGLPVYLVVESTSICNLKCIMCPYPSMGRKNEHMKMTVYEKLLAEAAGSVEFMWLHVFGEPLLNPNIYKMIDMAEEAGICTGISTNATKLDEKASAALLDSKLSVLVLCLDGATKKTFEHFRPGAKYEKVCENIARFAEMKQSRPGKLKATLQMILMAGNESEKQLFDQQWRDKGLDAILYKWFNSWANQDEKLIQIEQKQSPPPVGMCWEPWIGCTVLADGTVVPCCNDYSAKIPLGDLKTQSLGEIWNGEEMRKLRRRFIHNPRELEGTICQDCPYPVADPVQAAAGEGPFNPAVWQLNDYVFATEEMPVLRPQDPRVVNLTVRSAASSVRAGDVFPCEVTLANLSPWTLHSTGRNGIYLSYHWLDLDARSVVHDGLRTGLVPRLPGGAENKYVAQVLAPSKAGRYVLQVSLVQELVAWFDGWSPRNSDLWLVDVVEPESRLS